MSNESEFTFKLNPVKGDPISFKVGAMTRGAAMPPLP